MCVYKTSLFQVPAEYQEYKDKQKLNHPKA